MGQMGFFDIANRYAGLDAKNAPLAKIDAVVSCENGGAKVDHGSAAILVARAA